MSSSIEAPSNPSGLLPLKHLEATTSLEPTHVRPLNDDDGRPLVPAPANSLQHLNAQYELARRLTYMSLLDEQEALDPKTFVDLVWDHSANNTVPPMRRHVKSTRRTHHAHKPATGTVTSGLEQKALLSTIFDYITCCPNEHQINFIAELTGGDSEQVCKWFADEGMKPGYGDPGLYSLCNSAPDRYSLVLLRIVAHEFFQSWYQFSKHLPRQSEWERRESHDGSKTYFVHWSACWFEKVVALCWARLVRDRQL